MTTIRLSFSGFGNVGQGLALILAEQSTHLFDEYGLQFKIVSVHSPSRGDLYAPEGISPAALLLAANSAEDFAKLPGARDWRLSDVLERGQTDVLVEVSPTDLVTAQPATDYIRCALAAGKHVVTANKGPVALHYAALQELARENGVQFRAEGTVMAGTPSIVLGREILAPAEISGIKGILNGTTNYMLTEMESGKSYAEVLAQAQALGYAETDPSGDVEGFDAAGKLIILANLLFNLPLQLSQIARTGITQLTLADVQSAAAQGERWKLICELRQTDDGFSASVQPTRLSLSHPLAGVSGAMNAITYTTRLMGDVTLIGSGAGRVQTGFALLTDLLQIFAL